MDAPEYHESAIELRSISDSPSMPVNDTVMSTSEHGATHNQQTIGYERQSDFGNYLATGSSDVEAVERLGVEPNNSSNAEHNTERMDSAAQDQDLAGGFNAFERHGSTVSLIERLTLTAGASATSDNPFHNPTFFSVDSPSQEIINYDPEHLSIETDNPGWSPWLLRRRVLYSFMIAYGICIIVLMILSIVDLTHTGLLTISHDIRYVWTYGPTLVFSIIAVAWEPLDLRLRHLMPWDILRREPSPASQTLLLDYVSELQIVTLWRSIRSGHLIVALCTLSSILLKISTILSTGLFFVETTNVPFPHTELAPFDRPDPSIWNTTGHVVDRISLTAAANAVFAHENFNASYSPGISNEYAYPTIRLRNALTDKDFHNYTVEAAAEVVRGDLECEAGDLALYDSSVASPDIQITSPNCEVERAPWPSDQFGAQLTHGYKFNYLLGMMFALECDKTESVERRRLFFVAGYVYKNTTSSTTSSPRKAQNTTVWVCQPSIRGEQMNLVTNTAGALIQATPIIEHKADTILPEWALTSAFNDIFRGGTGHFKDTWKTMSDTMIDIDRDSWYGFEKDNVEHISQFDDFFNFYLSTTHPANRDVFVDPQTLLTQCRILYATVIAQIAKTHIFASSTQPSSGTLHTMLRRLHVRGPSLWAILGTLSLLLLLAVTQAIYVPRSVVSCDVGSIGGLATVLARSPKLNSILSGSGAASVKSLEKLLEKKECCTVRQSDGSCAQFSIEIKTSDPSTQTTLPKLSQPANGDYMQWWHPFVLTHIAHIGTIILLLSIIVAIEMTLKVSNNSEGLGTINTAGNLRYLWRFLPAILFVAVRSIVDMMTFNLKVLLPYHDLRISPRESQTTIWDRELFSPAVVNVYSCIAHGHRNLLVMTIATLLAWPLTVISSGLFISSTFESTRAATVQVEDSIRYMSDGQTGDANAMTGVYSTEKLSLAMNEGGIHAPSWTYDSFVFPRLSLDEYIVQNAGQKDNISAIIRIATPESTFNFEMPAWRSSLACDYVADQNRNITLDTTKDRKLQGNTPLPLFPDVQLQTPEGCSALNFSLSYNLNPDSGVESYYVMKFPYKSPSCPYMVFLYGDLPKEGAMDGEFTMLSCRAWTSQMQVHTNISYPTLRILDARPDESKSIVLNSNFSGKTDQREPLFDKAFLVLGGMYAPTSTHNDIFLPVLHVAGKSEKNLANFLGPTESAGFVEILSQLWSNAYVQLANIAGRVEGVDVGTQMPLTISGMVRDNDRLRLVQDRVSTHLLAVLLGLIALCVVVSLFTTRTRRILPKNPCSIAAVASLIAGSDMVREIPAGSEWCGTTGLEKESVFEGKFFSMGWWTDGDEQRFGIDVGKSRESI